MTWRMEKQWGLTIQHRELYPVSWDRPWWKIVWEKECIYVYAWVTVLYSRNWQNTVNQLNSNKNKILKKSAISMHLMTALLRRSFLFYWYFSNQDRNCTFLHRLFAVMGRKENSTWVYKNVLTIFCRNPVDSQVISGTKKGWWCESHMPALYVGPVHKSFPGF